MIMNEKSCQIFKNGNVVKIVTAYKLDIGYYRLSVPIYVLDISMGISSIINAVNDSLRASQDLESCTTLATKEFLRIIKERSLKVLYEKNSSCFIRLKNNHLTITPFNKEKRGLNLSEDKSIILSYDTITDKDYYFAIMSSL